MRRPRGEYFRTILFPIVFLVVFLSTVLAQAAVFDPGAGWQTIETKHFHIHYPKKIEAVAAKAAALLEEVYPGVTQKWSWKPWRYTEVVLVDSEDEANGFAAVLPYNWMLIYVVPPHPDTSLAHYDDWLKMLLTHEFTHVVQIDAYGGAWRVLRILLQKTVAPSGVNPKWMREGIAQYDETIFTGGGRGRGSYSEMVVRTSILEGTFPPIDVADGLGWRWPGYRAAYVYGLKFIQWLVDTYGEEKFLDLDRRIRSSVLIAMINHQARNVYGKTVYELWNEWEQSLTDKYKTQLKEIGPAGVASHEVIIPADQDEQFYAPTLSPDGTKLAYSVSSPHGHPEIHIVDMANGDDSILRKKQGATQFSWSRDGLRLTYSAIGGFKHYNRYYDLWVYDFGAKEKNKRVSRLTTGARARDPDFDPTGKYIVFVSGEAGTDVLKRMDVELREVVTLTPGVAQFTQFANPRVSPDGKQVAVSVWKPKEGWRIYCYNFDGSAPRRLTTGKGLAIESRPIWTPDGSHIIFSSDESGISNLYHVHREGGVAQKLTSEVTGVFQPTRALSPDVIALRYSPKGFEIARFSVPPVKGVRSREKLQKMRVSTTSDQQPATSDQQPATSDERPAADFKSRKYVAFGQSLFLPRYIVPNALYADDALYVSMMTGGADALKWQNWNAAVTYRTDANHVGYFLRYWYNRYRPLAGISVSDYAVNFGELIFPQAPYSTGRQVHFYEHRRAFSPFIGIPFGRNVIGAAYFYEDHMPKTTLADNESVWLNLGKFAGFRAEYRYGDSAMHPAAISREDGRFIRLTTSVTNKALGSGDRNEQAIFSGDWREYVELWRHHVFALRASGGITWGDQLVQGTFGLGGAMGEGAFGGGGSFNYFPLRGLPVSFLSRTRAMLFSGEYRFPLFSPQRGLGTLPVFLEDISAALFADYGNAWNAHEGGCDKFSTFFNDFLLGVGTELRGDFVIGHGLPVHGRLGYGIVVLNRNRLAGYIDPILGAPIRDGFLILTLGASF